MKRKGNQRKEGGDNAGKRESKEGKLEGRGNEKKGKAKYNKTIIQRL